MTFNVRSYLKERQERQGHEQVVNRRDDRADAEADLETKADVQQDGGHRQHGRPDALARQFFTDDGADDLAADNAEVAETGLLQGAGDLLARAAQ